MLEPYGGGSHAAFCRGWQTASCHSITLLELPAMHWKWRSRHSSFTLAAMAQSLPDVATFDVVVCSEMLNLAEWRGFVGPPLSELPSVVYFHENQFTYPLAEGQSRDYHFAYTNILNALAATEVWFNSAFHRTEFTSAALSWLRRMPDYRHVQRLEQVLLKAQVMPPGIMRPAGVGSQRSAAKQPLTLGWVSRWEHDKRPDRFATAMETLLAREVPLQLILLGQQFPRRPAGLERLLSSARAHIRHCGHVETQQEYWAWLAEMDVVISTADHEFFGIGIVEAIAAGCRPLLPDRLSYPEVLEVERYPERRQYLYDGSVDDLVARLQSWLTPESLAHDPTLQDSCQRFHWSQVARRNDERLTAIVNSRAD
jgi:glycosyltransferase involved in cell wall biosynthesis